VGSGRGRVEKTGAGRAGQPTELKQKGKAVRRRFRCAGANEWKLRSHPHPMVRPGLLEGLEGVLGWQRSGLQGMGAGYGPVCQGRGMVSGWGSGDEAQSLSCKRKVRRGLRSGQWKGGVDGWGEKDRVKN